MSNIRPTLNCTESCSCCDNGAKYYYIKPYSKGGSDHPWNLVPFCDKHLKFAVRYGLVRISLEFLSLENMLKKKKWEINPSTIKWCNYEPEVTRSHFSR